MNDKKTIDYQIFNTIIAKIKDDVYARVRK